MVHHRVDGVLEFQDLAAHVDGDLLGQVAVGHRGGDFGDVAHLARQVGRHQVHVVGQVLPGPADALDLRLPSELALRADLAGDAGHLRSEGVQLVHHRIDGQLQGENLALHIDGNLLGQVAPRDRGRDLGDVAHLARQVFRHHVHVVGQVLPDAADALDLRLPSELALRPHLLGDAGHFRGEGIELVHHRVDGRFQVEDLALHVDGDLLGQVAVGHRGGDFGDVAHLARQVGRHQVHVVGQVLPGPADALDLRLPSELALRADLAGDAGHLRSEGVQLVHHRVDDLADPKELAAQGPALDLDLHGLAEVALGDGPDDARHLGGGLNKVADHRVDRLDAIVPPAGRGRKLSALADAPVLADRAGDPVELTSEPLVELDDIVERLRDLPLNARQIQRQPSREVTLPKGTKALQEELRLQLQRSRRHAGTPLG